MASEEALKAVGQSDQETKESLLEQSREMVEEAIQLKRQIEALGIVLETYKNHLKDVGRVTGVREIPGLVSGHKALISDSEKRVLDVSGLEDWLTEEGHPERLRHFMKVEIGPVKKAYGDAPFEKYGEIIPLPCYSIKFEDK
jgi:hypothetical protein